MNGSEEHPKSDEINSSEMSSAEEQRAELKAEKQQAELEAKEQRAKLEAEVQRAELEAEKQRAKLVEVQKARLEAEVQRARLEVQKAKLAAEVQRAMLEAAIHQAKLAEVQQANRVEVQQAKLVEVQRGRRKKVLRAITVGLLFVIFVGLGYVPVNIYTTRNNERLAAKLAGQIDALGDDLAQTQIAASQVSNAEIQSLAQEVAFLKNKIDSELKANKTGMEAIKEANDQIFFLFVFLSGVGSFFGFATWYGGRQEQQDEKERGSAMFALQEKNLEEVNTITTAIAAGATQNVESLNTMLSTFQKIMDFKVAEAENVQKDVQKMEGQLKKWEEAQRQQVEELLQNAVRLRRSRHIYTSPDPDLRRQLEEFRTQMDLMQRVMLDQHAGVESPAENRHYGEIYLRRGVIAYYDNDMAKSRETLKIAERFFPVPESGNKSLLQDQKFQTAFTQFYLALIEKNYGVMTAAQGYIEKSYAVYSKDDKKELLTPVTRAEILSYLGDMEDARAAIQEVLDRADNLRKREPLERHDANYALRARLLLGNTYYVRKEWEQALQHYQETLKADERRNSSYYVYYSIAQVHHQLDDAKKAKKHRRRAYEELVETRHLQTKVALDTRILLNALAYLCTREDMPQEAEEYRETVQRLWRRIYTVNGLQLRLFSFERKQPISKEDFWTEVFSG